MVDSAIAARISSNNRVWCSEAWFDQNGTTADPRHVVRSRPSPSDQNAKVWTNSQGFPKKTHHANQRNLHHVLYVNIKKSDTPRPSLTSKQKFPILTWNSLWTIKSNLTDGLTDVFGELRTHMWTMRGLYIVKMRNYCGKSNWAVPLRNRQCSHHYWSTVPRCWMTFLK